MKHLVRALAFAVGLSCALPAYAAENIKAQVSAAAESSHVFCDATGTSPVRKAPCFIRSIYVTSGASAGWLMTFNAVTAPADGAVTPRECVAIPALTTIALDFDQTTEDYTTGMVAVFSSTGCFLKTASPTAFFKSRVQ